MMTIEAHPLHTTTFHAADCALATLYTTTRRSFTIHGYRSLSVSYYYLLMTEDQFNAIMIELKQLNAAIARISPTEEEKEKRLKKMQEERNKTMKEWTEKPRY